MERRNTVIDYVLNERECFAKLLVLTRFSRYTKDQKKIAVRSRTSRMGGSVELAQDLARLVPALFLQLRSAMLILYTCVYIYTCREYTCYLMNTIRTLLRMRIALLDRVLIYSSQLWRGCHLSGKTYGPFIETLIIIAFIKKGLPPPMI